MHAKIFNHAICSKDRNSKLVESQTSKATSNSRMINASNPVHQKPVVALLTIREVPICEEATSLLRDVADVQQVWSKGWIVDKELIDAVRDATAIIVRVGKVTDEVMKSCKNLKIIAVHGVGVDRVDIEAATRRGIIVTNAPFGNVDSVAEFTFGLILSLYKKIPATIRFVKEGKWLESRSLGRGEIINHTIGVVGIGNIGLRVAKIAKAFGMTVLAYDPYVSKENVERLGARLVGLDTLLKESDIVTLHTPLTETTRHLIGKAELALMKRTAVIINTSRGAVLDNAALYDALQESRVAGAALDVTEKEPYEPNDPLAKLDNVIITSRVAGMTEEADIRVAVTAAQDVAKYLKGETPSFVANREVLREKK